ncbi:2-dehydropantoate 2-reductase [Roseomonas sp. HJA6]|uniref:2-dehydropantoate 2-reductase n=1 Tax=Roseomonas alba TaxID=2846776 RepID=A0ABS7AF10_9PROT|nr:2-dehydropantoate 2-reductase [Neoroseomonas alba]MBW6400889.1 2-dehydropantoate 2-reductase [Neoroseomonas alba]
MKVAVMGAGSIGCYYGGLLARAGLPVTLIGRRQHVDAVTERGLLMDVGGEQHRVPMPATTEARGVADADLVLFCVKSGDTEAVGREIAPHLRPDVTILSLQNGVDNPERLEAVVSRTVVPVAVYVATEMAGPGHVRHKGRGDLVMGPSPRDAEIVARFAAAGVPVQVSDQAMDALWGKLIVNCAYNALSALTQLPYGRLLQMAGVEAVMRDIVAECVAVATASGVSVAPDILPAVLGLARSMATQKSSTAQDLSRGKPTEIDHLNGIVVRKGAELGIPTPVNRVLVTLVKAVEVARAEDAGMASAT